MDNQKDTKKTNLNSYGQANFLDVKMLTNKHIYELVNKKTEKLVTALYMVTDCMDTDDALKGKLRLLGVELLSDIYKLSTISSVDKHLHISTFLVHIDEILSFVEISYTMGFISEMNTIIIKKEFMILVGELENLEEKDKHFSFALDEQMFSFPGNHSYKQDLAESGIKDKKTLSDSMSFINNRSPLQSFKSNKVNHSVFNLNDKKDRIEKILNLIKEKKNLSIGQVGISIKDISNSFTDCSEKTIQRELNSLVLKGQIKKTGAKRWSRYQAI